MWESRLLSQGSLLGSWLAGGLLLTTSVTMNPYNRCTDVRFCHFKTFTILGLAGNLARTNNKNWRREEME